MPYLILLTIFYQFRTGKYFVRFFKKILFDAFFYEKNFILLPKFNEQ